MAVVHSTSDIKIKLSDVIGDESSNELFVFDRRSGSGPAVRIPFKKGIQPSELKRQIVEAFDIPTKEDVVVLTTSRHEISDSDVLDDVLSNGDTLYILYDADQELCAPVQERVEYLPHYDTLVKSGMYEYYASEGQNPLPFALAELIDNSLAATANNPGVRTIEVKLLFDDNVNKSSICVFDNGKGMSSRDLNNWAIYRLSKFNRRIRKGQDPCDTSILNKEDMPRSLNSDISYFGVGGKQAIFFIGNATRLISKSAASNDVHELCLSKEDFERKEKEKKAVYSGFIRNRRAGDFSHISKDEDNLIKLIEEEPRFLSFTNVCITEISAEHISYLKSNFAVLTRQLSHIYHYYLHGPSGNVVTDICPDSGLFREINISVSLFEKGKQPKRINLRDIDDDIHTQFIRSAVSAFEFRAHVEGAGVVEGVIRYHPFLYDRETYPLLPGSDSDSENEDDSVHDARYPRGNKPMFECYWNGRLIPYTTIDCLDWCAPPRKGSMTSKCYYRTSGTLFTGDGFQVSTNKLTFMDLELKLKEQNVLFTRVILGQEQRVSLVRAYGEWIRSCHKHCDKQIKFFGNAGITKRQLKRGHQSLTNYENIEWENKVFSVGMLAKVWRTTPIVMGTISTFILPGNHEEEEIYATGGDIELIQEPASIWGEKKLFPLVKLDRNATPEGLKKMIAEEEARLPSKIVVEWPEGDGLSSGDKLLAGTTIGAMKVDILNGKSESVNKIPGEKGRRLLVELTLTWHSEKEGNKILSKHTCQHGGKNWPYWFRKMENITNLGRHSLKLNAILSDVDATLPEKYLPKTVIAFQVIEGIPKQFAVDSLDSPVQIGSPFQVTLNLSDEFGHAVKPKKLEVSPILTASGLELSHGSLGTKGMSVVIKDVVAKGSLGTSSGKEFTMKILIPKLTSKCNLIKMKVIPGVPARLVVTPIEDEIEVENGSNLKFYVTVVDCHGNPTVQQRLDLACKFTGVANLPVYTLDCSASAKGVLTGECINIKGLKNAQKLKAVITIQHHKLVPAVEKTVWVNPSSRPAQLEIFYQPAGSDLKKKLVDEQEVPCLVGEVISGLAYRILDEGNRLMNIDSSITSKIKVNWMAKTPREGLKTGNLPDVKAPTSAQEVKFCQVSFVSRGTSVEFSFYLRPKPGKPQSIKCSCSHPKLRVGEHMESEILVKPCDSYGNTVELTSNDVDDFEVSSPGLDTAVLKKTLRMPDGLVITDIKFFDDQVETKELLVKWNELECHQRIQVLAGPPTGMAFVNFDYQTLVTVVNNQNFPYDLKMQLVDANGHPAKEANARISLSRDPGLKLTPPPLQQKTDKNGCAEFKDFTVSGKRGTYRLTPKVTLGGSTFEGPVITLCIEPDRTKPVSVRIEMMQEDSKHIAGQKLPMISVCVLAEDDNPMVDVNVKEMILKVWYVGTDAASDTPPNKALTFMPSKISSKNEPGYFYFRDVAGLEIAGPHRAVAQYLKSGQVLLMSKPLLFTISAGVPVKIEPVKSVNIPTVSNGSKILNRVLISNLRLNLRDEFGNLAGANMEGLVSVHIASDGVCDHPVFDNGHDYKSFKMTHGEVLVDKLILQSNCSGIDGQEYILTFTATATANPELKIEPFSLPFLFYNDIIKQAQMAQLSRERDKLVEVIRNYRALFDATSQLIEEIRGELKEAKEHERVLLDDLRKAGFYDINAVSTVEKVINMISKFEEKKLAAQKIKRRQCQIPPGPRSQDVLGKIAHLAQIEDDNVAGVLSWHLSGDMDCIVTKTTEEAKRIYKETNGRQQVLSIDSVYKKSINDWNKPLPHVKIRGYRPSGNPAYIKSLLHFPYFEQDCKLVFGMLLGDIIVMDSLDTAIDYRREVVKCTYCPTILTRTGDRVRGNGKFGGLQNRAPPLDRLRGAVFSAPIPFEYKDACTKIDLLIALRDVLKKKKTAHDELAYQIKHGQSEDMLSKYKECRETENQLKDIENRLGLTPSLHNLPSPGGFQAMACSPPVSHYRSPCTFASPSQQTESSPSKRSHSESRNETPTSSVSTRNSRSRRSLGATPDVKRKRVR